MRVDGFDGFDADGFFHRESPVIKKHAPQKRENETVELTGRAPETYPRTGEGGRLVMVDAYNINDDNYWEVVVCGDRSWTGAEDTGLRGVAYVGQIGLI